MSEFAHIISNIAAYDNFYSSGKKIESVGTHRLFRNYAYRNKMEFFAVAIELFFELPDILKTELPELYRVLSNLLNQDLMVLYGERTADKLPE